MAGAFFVTGRRCKQLKWVAHCCCRWSSFFAFGTYNLDHAAALGGAESAGPE
jgi:hypothetical protein